MGRAPIAYRTLYPRTPWLYPLSDVRAVGPAEVQTEWSSHERIDGYVVHGLADGPQIVVIHAVMGNGNDGGLITLSISPSISIDTTVEPAHSNPRRIPDPLPEDDGA